MLKPMKQTNPQTSPQTNTKSYKVKEIYLTLQGEGIRSGRRAVFCRFSGCNLWSGREQDRHTAVCSFCDTDFVGGSCFENPEALVAECLRAWYQGSFEAKSGMGDTTGDGMGHPKPQGSALRANGAAPYVVITGGEPMLQLDAELLRHFKQAGFEVAVETNGTIKPSSKVLGLIDWLTVSPKQGAPLRLTRGDELKLVMPQDFSLPNLERLAFSHFLVQPMATPSQDHTSEVLELIARHPKWGLSLQLHKILGVA